MKKIYRYAVMLIMGIVFSTILMLGVNLIPVARMQIHLKESTDVLEQEKEYHQVIPGLISSRLDNFTDSIMLLTASYERKTGVVDQTVNAYRVFYGDMTPTEVVKEYCEGNEKYTTAAYSRYWHGYQVLLKPLLLFMNYQEIRFVNSILVMCVFVMVICGMMKKRMNNYIVPYVFMMGSLMPMCVGLSLQFSSVYYISNIGIYLFLTHRERDTIDVCGYFLLLGMCTSFFDLLTYPLVTLGAPLVFCVLIKNNSKALQNVILVMKGSLAWGIGYAGMWSGKWFIGSILLGRNIVNDAINSIFIRTSSEVSEKTITAGEVIKQNYDAMFDTTMKKVFLMAILVGVLILIIYSIMLKENCFGYISYVLIAFMPICWYVVMKNHSYVHFWFTYRELSISVLAIGVWLMKNMETSKMKLYEKRYEIKKEKQQNG